MEARYCSCCKKAFHLRTQCPKQKYCSKRACQRERKKIWQRNKLKSDPAYRENQRDSQQRWRGSHPFYHRDYRLKHPDYVARNREQQRQRDQASRLAKMDASMGEISIPSGRYKLTPVHTSGLAKMDAWMVNISVVSTGCALAP